jgi:CheY-like chemotaxis protein
MIDDDRVQLLLTRELLRDEGWEVELQAGPFGATERIMTARPDVVLLDINMPALSGEMLLPLFKAREQTRETPVVLYSSNDEDSLRQAARRLGAAGYVRKGDLPSLFRVLDEVARPARPRGGGLPRPA